MTASSTWKLPEISFTQQHDYSGEDPAKLLPVTYKVMAGYGQDKPVLLAEQGLDSVGASGQAGLEIVHFHNGIWAAPFSGYAGSSMYWWWDTYIDPRNLWGEYKGLADFLKDEDLAPLAPAKTQIAPEGATALALQGTDRALVWVRSDDYTIAAARQAYEKARAAGEGSFGLAVCAAHGRGSHADAERPGRRQLPRALVLAQHRRVAGRADH